MAYYLSPWRREGWLFLQNQRLPVGADNTSLARPGAWLSLTAGLSASQSWNPPVPIKHSRLPEAWDDDGSFSDAHPEMWNLRGTEHSDGEGKPACVCEQGLMGGRCAGGDIFCSWNHMENNALQLQILLNSSDFWCWEAHNKMLLQKHWASLRVGNQNEVFTETEWALYFALICYKTNVAIWGDMTNGWVLLYSVAVVSAAVMRCPDVLKNNQSNDSQVTSHNHIIYASASSDF